MIAIIQGGCFGDNVNSTLMLKPLKNKFETEIHIYTSERYHTPFINNPYVDDIIKVDTNSKDESLNLARTLKPVGYDLVINSHPLINRNWSSNLHPELGENLILAWVNTLESMDIKYDYPLETELYLTSEEMENINNFINKLNRRDGVVLMECEGESGQSFWSNRWTTSIIDYLTKRNKTILVSCRNQIKTFHNNVIWVGNMSIRTVSGIFDHCDAFISVSSGLSNACNVIQRSKNVKWFEVVNSLTCSSNVIRSDGKIFHHDNNIDSFIKKLEINL
jgi:ADP-heptose:LPS heptosyltransferase